VFDLVRQQQLTDFSSDPEFQRNLTLLQDLTLELLGESRKVDRAIRVSALLVEKLGRSDENGVVATLLLERLLQGTGTFVRATNQAFVQRLPDFVNAENDACEYVRRIGLWRNDWDVRWQMEMRDGKPVPNVLKGPSAGAGLAVAIAWLFAE
jgi:hypothetical protein